MPTEFKVDYKSFTARLDVFCKPTHWELLHGVTITDKEIIPFSDDLKLALISKSDNTKTLIVFYNGSKNSNPCWFGWIPSKEQLSHFSQIVEIYERLDLENYKRKQVLPSNVPEISQNNENQQGKPGGLGTL